jgi:hypothetical protein
VALGVAYLHLGAVAHLYVECTMYLNHTERVGCRAFLALPTSHVDVLRYAIVHGI